MIKINGVVRTDKDFPLGFMDVLTIDSANENYRVMYSNTRKFVLIKISAEEASFRLEVVVKKKVVKNVPYIYTRSGGSFRYCDPAIGIKDTIKVCNKTNTVIEHLPFAYDMKAFIVRGKNMGCVGTIKNIEKHDGGNDIAYIEDSVGRGFATRSDNVFIIGDADKIIITLPSGDGVKLAEIEKSNLRFGPINMDENKDSVEEAIIE